MSPIQEALTFYGEFMPKLHGAYTEKGYVYSAPDCIAMARPCNSARPLDWVPHKEADAWWIEYAGGRGKLADMIKHLPYDLPLIGWMRGLNGKKNPRFYKLENLRNKLNG